MTQPPSLERGLTRVAGFTDPEMDFQLIRHMGTARYGGAAVGECLALARRIEDGVPASWVQVFSGAARRWQEDAAQRAAKGHAISAGDLYLVACNHYRAAEYYSPLDDGRHRDLGLASRTCFLEAMRLQQASLDTVFLSLDDGSTFPAYFFRTPHSSGKPCPTLMIQSGYDGTLEETWLAYGRAALERGYHLMLYAAPGQMDTFRFDAGAAFIPDMERAAAAALDYLAQQPEVDQSRIALMGISFGGYFALRSAVFEPRIRALILNSPVTDLHAYMVSFAGVDPATLPASDDFTLADLEHIPDSEIPPHTRLMSRNLMLRFGGHGFRDTYRQLQQYRLDEADLRTLDRPALGLIGAGEGAEPLSQYEQFRRVTGAAGHVFTAEDGADGHCQTGNLAYAAAVGMDWLDEVFG